MTTNLAEMAGIGEATTEPLPVSDVEQQPHTELVSVPDVDDSAGTDDVAAADREAARALWRERAGEGIELSGRELGTLFDRSERWGRDRIAEARPDRPGTRAARRGGGSGKGRAATGGGKPAARRNGGPGGSASADVAVDGDPETSTGTASGGAVPDLTGKPGETGQGVPVPVPPVDGMPVGDVPVSRAARLVAWCGFLFGTVISVAANVLYSWLPTLAGEAAAPGLAPQIGAAVWPIALVLSIEALSRVRWPGGLAWQAARYGGAGVVALGAALISYGHLHGVLDAWHYGAIGAGVGPLVVDGLMTVSGFALLALGGHGKAADR